MANLIRTLGICGLAGSLSLLAYSQSLRYSGCNQEEDLLDGIRSLEKRLSALEGAAPRTTSAPATVADQVPAAATTAPPSTNTASRSISLEVIPAAATINVYLDGYYSYNFRRPFTGTNALRAYDVSSNSFAINQAGLIIARAPDVTMGHRWGGRLDLMFGQATETLQGSPANEPRPEVFRHLFQAYGTVVAPVGKGVTLDFGKWASSFGIENNYTKDQFNYSRSYWFNFLPFYHMGLRASYPVTSRLSMSYWLVNGLNQTEEFNSFKSQAVLLSFAPSSRLSANLNYYNGQEHRAVDERTPRGRSHFLDAYVTWQASDRWTLAGEADYAIERTSPGAAPKVVFGGAGYARYSLTRKVHLVGRFAYLNDRNGWFSGTNQALKDATGTATFDLGEGFQMRWELRRDWSNRACFAGKNPGERREDQVTALVGLIWWFGTAKGAW